MTDEDKVPKGYQKFQDRVLELVGGDVDKVEISKKLAELELDYEFIKDLNTQLANKYQELMETFPTVKELDYTIKEMEHNTVFAKFPEEEVRNQERLTKVKKFRSALVALESQDPTAKPVRYDELFNNDKTT